MVQSAGKVFEMMGLQASDAGPICTGVERAYEERGKRANARAKLEGLRMQQA